VTGLVALDGGEHLGLLARFTERPAEPEGIDEVDAPEGLVAHDPARAHLGVRDELDVGPERRVVVDPHGRGEEAAVLPGKLLLQVAADRGVLDEVVAAERDGGGGQVGSPAAPEIARRWPRWSGSALVDLAADG
jgi:hypothetical protein